jgi:hypothetical protein
VCRDGMSGTSHDGKEAPQPVSSFTSRQHDILEEPLDQEVCIHVGP